MNNILSHLYQRQLYAGDLLQSETIDPTRPVASGVGNESRLILFHKQDLLTVTESTITADLVKALTLAPNKSATVFEGYRQSLKPKYRAVRSSSGITQYSHELDYFVFNYAQTTKNNLTRKGYGRYVALYENAKQDGNTFELMGLDVGLELIEMQRAPQEDGGAFKIRLTTPENEYESKMPRTFYDELAYASTLTLVNGLVKLPTIGAPGIAPLAAAAAGGTALTITGTNFFGGGTNNAVLSVQWINQATGAVVNQAAYTVVSDTSITCNSPAMAAGLYKLKITTIKGSVQSVSNLVVT